MSFRLVPNSVILDDLEQHNNFNVSVISLNSVAFCKRITLKIHRYFLLPKCRPNNLVFSNISFMTTLAGDHPSESVKK